MSSIDETFSHPFHTPAQLAKRWLCSPKKVHREIKSGALIAHKFGAQWRISDSDRLTYERLHRRG